MLSGLIPACWWIFSTVAGPSNLHQPGSSPLSILLESRALLIANRMLIAKSKAGSPVALEPRTPHGFLEFFIRVTLKSWGMSFAAGGLYSQVFLVSKDGRTFIIIISRFTPLGGSIGR